MNAHGLMAVTVGRVPPIVAVLYHAATGLDNDSGFSVLFSDAPEDGSELAPDDERLQAICVHCLLDSHPEVGRGLDLAREHGEADRDPSSGAWWAEGEG